MLGLGKGLDLGVEGILKYTINWVGSALRERMGYEEYLTRSTSNRVLELAKGQRLSQRSTPHPDPYL